MNNTYAPQFINTLCVFAHVVVIVGPHIVLNMHTYMLNILFLRICARITIDVFVHEMEQNVLTCACYALSH